MQDDQISSTAHLKGLNKIIALRGGFGAFSGIKVLQRVIAWCVASSNIVFLRYACQLTLPSRSRRSYYLRWYNLLSLPPLPPLSRPYFDEQDQIYEDIEISMQQLTTNDDYAGIISCELIDVLDGFQVIASYPTQTLRTPSQRLHISQAILDVEYKLMLLHQNHLSELAGLSSTFTTLAKPFQLAAQLYVLLVLRQLPARSSVVQKYAEPLAAELLPAKLSWSSLDQRRSTEWRALLIWILVLLLVATFDLQARHRLISLLVSLSDMTGIEVQQQVVRSLRDVAWIDGIFEEELTVICNEIETTMGKHLRSQLR